MRQGAPSAPPGRRGRRCALLGGLLALLGLVSVACYTGTGSYPVETFSEMHYQQSYKSQEPPRLLPPEGSVPRATPAPRATGAELFAGECSMCHGARGKGDGGVLQVMATKYSYTPVLDPDLTSAAVQALSVEDLVRIISAGVVAMPSFQNLLTPQEQALIAEYIKTLP